MIPAGPLRERLNEIKNYDVVFLNGEKNNIKFYKTLKKINKNLKIFNSKYMPTNLKSFNLKKIFIFLWTRKSKKFEKTLLKYKFKIEEKFVFPDHYNFTNQDIKEIKKIAKEKKLDIVTSEKDYLRLNNFNKKNIKFLKVDLKIKNLSKFESYVKSVL